MVTHYTLVKRIQQERNCTYSVVKRINSVCVVNLGLNSVTHEENGNQLGYAGIFVGFTWLWWMRGHFEEVVGHERRLAFVWVDKFLVEAGKVDSVSGRVSCTIFQLKLIGVDR